jgi:hypothetical protein
MGATARVAAARLIEIGGSTTIEAMARAGLIFLFALFGAGCRSSLTDPGDARVDAGGQCHDLFHVEADGSSPEVPCCPDPAPDCTNLADGYPGCECVDRRNQFCACMCSQHVWTCAC